MSQWIGGQGNNNWDNGLNWSPNGEPGASTSVTVSAGSTITLDVSVTSTGTLDLTGGAGTITIDGNGSNSFTFDNLDGTLGETLLLSQTNLSLSTGITLSGTSGAFTIEDGSFNDKARLTLSAGEELVLVNTTLTQTSPISGAGTLVLDGASVYDTGSSGPSSVIDFETVTSGHNNTLAIQPYTALGPIENFGQGDTIAVGSGNTLTIKSNGSGAYTLVENTYTTLTTSLTLAAGLTAADFASNNGNFDYSPSCFLAGTQITTVNGDVAVEDIRLGDELVSGAAGGRATHRVIWTGKQYVTPADATAYPVRFLANAIAEGIPAADLLVTPEHCIYLDGKLVPARLLVNGRSIHVDTTRHGFYVYHIETETHAILVANGAAAETYLDTGNRKHFVPLDESNIAFASFGGAKSSDHDAAAPVVTDHATAEPFFRALEARALALGFPLTFPASSVTAKAG